MLGLAGVAARSGVQSTLGSLWRVRDDTQAQLIEDFYQNFRSMPKAQALQQAQIQQIARNGVDPMEWAGITLIGSWK